MNEIGDLDPAYAGLRYIADRFELNIEQRYWIAYLYAMTYCLPTVFFMYNDFPDYENVDAGRLARWWAAHRNATVFQTDRRWIRSRNQFCDAVASYRSWIGGRSQESRFRDMLGPSPQATYDRAYASAGSLYQMGRFGLFLYLEAIHAITGLPMEPTGLDLRNAESSRNGLCYAIGADAIITGHETGRSVITARERGYLEGNFQALMAAVRDQDGLARGPRARPSTVWSVETSLCAFKKVCRGKRYLGYYIDRLGGEIEKLEANVSDGVDWSVLWDFRREYFDHGWLSEYGASNLRKQAGAEVPA